MAVEPRLTIRGRPTEEEAAAIMAAVAHVLAVQRAGATKPPPRPALSAWVRAGQTPRMEGAVPGIDPGAPPV